MRTPALYPHQVDGVRFLRGNARAVLADEMGLGKTAQVLAALDALPAVVVCPASVRSVWHDEVRMWRPELCVDVITTGGQVPNPAADVTVLSYDLFARGLKHKLRAPGTLVCDEAHYLQSRTSKRTKKIMASAAPTTSPRCLRVTWLLTGTPVWSRPRSLFTLLQLVAGPAGMGPYHDYHRYATRYCGGHRRFQPGAGWVFDDSGATNLDELRDKFAPYVLRRLKTDVLNLPEKTRQLIRFDTGLSKAETEIGDPLNLVEGLGGNGLPPGPIATAVRETALLKLPAALRYLRDDVLASTHKAVVFAWNREVLDGLAAGLEGYPLVRIDGSTKHQDRAAAVRAFQQDHRVRVFLGQTAAAGTGITLTAADTVVFVQPEWTPANLLQAEDRVHRIGQRGTVSIQYLVTAGSIEEYMLSVVGDKLGAARQILGD